MPHVFCMIPKPHIYIYIYSPAQTPNSTRSAHPSPSLDRLLHHLVALAITTAQEQEDPVPPARLEADLARRLLDWLRRLKGPKARLAAGMAALGREQGWSYDVVEGCRLLTRGPAPVAIAAASEEEEEAGDEI